MIVVDASAAVSALLSAGAARDLVAREQVHAPHLVDVEVVNAVRGLVAAHRLDAGDAWPLLDTWRYLGLVRHPVPGLVERIWQLRDNLSAYDASYVALAEALGCTLITADGRLGRAPGLQCPITVVPG